MIFKQAQQVVDGTKRQTRRPVKPGERRAYQWPDGIFYYFQDEPSYIPTVIIEYPVSLTGPDCRIRWQEGKTYAVQPGRGQKSIGRIRLLEIRRERLQEISLEDIKAEGITTPEEFARIWGEAITRSWLEIAYKRLKKGDLRNAFRYMWRSLYEKPHRWEDNPDVWVLEFELVKQ